MQNLIWRYPLIKLSEGSNYICERKIGRGKYSEVFESMNALNSQPCVVKLLKPSKLSTNDSKVQEDKPWDQDPDGAEGTEQHSEVAGHRKVSFDWFQRGRNALFGIRACKRRGLQEAFGGDKGARVQILPVPDFERTALLPLVRHYAPGHQAAECDDRPRAKEGTFEVIEDQNNWLGPGRVLPAGKGL